MAPVAEQDSAVQGSVAVDRFVAAPTRRTVYAKEDLEDLAASIKSVGIIEPVVVRAVGGGLEIIAGDRRIQAAKLAGRETLRADEVKIVEANDVTAAEMRLAENELREDFHPIDRLTHYEALVDLGRTAEEIALRFGKPLKFVKRILIYGNLDERARKAFRTGKIGAEVAFMIARLPNDDDRVKVLRYALGGGQTNPAYRPDVGMVAREIDRSILLQLGRASFPLNVAIGGVVSCQDCPKRTGNQPALFDAKDLPFDQGLDTDRCTDGTCYQAKSVAWLEQQAADLRAQGQPVLDIKEAAAKEKKAIAAKQLKHALVVLSTSNDHRFNYEAPQKALGKLYETKCLAGCPDFAFIPRDGRLVPACFNEGNLKKLLREARGEREDRNGAAGTAGRKGSGGEAPVGAQGRVQRERRDGKFTERAQEFIDVWLVGQVPAKLEKAPGMMLRMALAVACLQYRETSDVVAGAEDQDDTKATRAYWKKLGFDPLVGGGFGDDRWAAISKLSDAQVGEVLRAILTRMAPSINRQMLYDVGQKVGVVPAKQFVLTKEMLEVHTIAELVGIAKEIGAKELGDGMGKRELVEALAKRMKAGKLPKAWTKVAEGASARR